MRASGTEQDITSQESAGSGRGAKLLKGGWMTLKSVLKVVGDGSSVFPPLQSALAGVVAIMDLVDVR